ncbi:MAG: hypothetical protein IPP62_17665 [bacterium]|nr:hypothetical protein [bacterium]
MQQTKPPVTVRAAARPAPAVFAAEAGVMLLERCEAKSTTAVVAMFNIGMMAKRMITVLAMGPVLLLGATAFCATYEVTVPLAALGDSTDSAILSVDLGGPARLTQPVRVHATVNVEDGNYHCNSCGSWQWFPTPNCEWDIPMGMVIHIEVSSGGATATTEWWQNASGSITLDLAMPDNAARDLMFSDGTGTVSIYYFRHWYDAFWACRDSGGGGGMTSPGLLEFPGGMTILIDYDSLVPSESSTWGEVKAIYR